MKDAVGDGISFIHRSTVVSCVIVVDFIVVSFFHVKLVALRMFQAFKKSNLIASTIVEHYLSCTVHEKQLLKT
jgi:hypothetical protein